MGRGGPVRGPRRRPREGHLGKLAGARHRSRDGGEDLLDRHGRGGPYVPPSDGRQEPFRKGLGGGQKRLADIEELVRPRGARRREGLLEEPDGLSVELPKFDEGRTPAAELHQLGSDPAERDGVVRNPFQGVHAGPRGDRLGDRVAPRPSERDGPREEPRVSIDVVVERGPDSVVVQREAIPLLDGPTVQPDHPRAQTGDAEFEIERPVRGPIAKDDRSVALGDNRGPARTTDERGHGSPGGVREPGGCVKLEYLGPGEVRSEQAPEEVFGTLEFVGREVGPSLSSADRADVRFGGIRR